MTREPLSWTPQPGQIVDIAVNESMGKIGVRRAPTPPPIPAILDTAVSHIQCLAMGIRGKEGQPAGIPPLALDLQGVVEGITPIFKVIQTAHSGIDRPLLSSQPAELAVGTEFIRRQLVHRGPTIEVGSLVPDVTGRKQKALR